VMYEFSWWSVNVKNSWRQKERRRPRLVDDYIIIEYRLYIKYTCNKRYTEPWYSLKRVHALCELNIFLLH